MSSELIRACIRCTIRESKYTDPTWLPVCEECESEIFGLPHDEMIKEQARCWQLFDSQRLGYGVEYPELEKGVVWRAESPNTGRFWVEPAWQQLVMHCEANGVMLGEAYQHDLEDPELGAGRPETKQAAIINYKTVMAGYWLIASGRASDTVVDQVYATLKRSIREALTELRQTEGMPLDQFIEVLRAEEGRQGTIYDVGYLGACLRLQHLRNSLVNGSRIDKVNAIETVIHTMHEEGSMVTLLVGYGVRGGKMDRITESVLDLLANREV